ncbi:hypothetical protein BDR04DRAFT_1105737 [Suillus decipiens]|nr:hypothetical protein BDR04DRAFT_1105737 [Suillus decipiens]
MLDRLIGATSEAGVSESRESGASVRPMAAPFYNKTLRASLRTDGGASGYSLGFVRCKRQRLSRPSMR